MTSNLVRESAAGQVSRILGERILNGELLPGARLRELHLASEFNISQGPIREAFRELEAQGLVHTEPYKGTSVREVTKRDLREAYMVRASLEQLAGRLAGAKLKGKVDHLRSLATQIQHAAQAKDIPAYVTADVGFHRGIVAATENKILLRSWEALGFEVRMQIRLANSSVDLFKVQQEHWPILDALNKGHGARAGKLLEQHVFRFSKL